MRSKKVLITGSSGLVGSETCLYFGKRSFKIHGVDNNQRAVFFGPQGDTRWNQIRLLGEIPGFTHHELDIRDRQGILDLLGILRPDYIVHTASQPSHDRAATIPFDDFDTNAVGTFNLLEAARRAPRMRLLFIFRQTRFTETAPTQFRCARSKRAGSTKTAPSRTVFRRTSQPTNRHIRSLELPSSLPT